MTNLLSITQYLYETTLSQMKTINELVQPDLFIKRIIICLLLKTFCQPAGIFPNI